MKKKQLWLLALAVRCPTCLQQRKKKCLSLETGKLKRWPHPARVTAYNQTKDCHDFTHAPALQQASR